MLPPETLHITDTQIFKIFPKDYYKKYGKHIQILELQKRVMDEEKKKVHSKQLLFQPRKKQIQEKLPDAIFRKTQIYQFDDNQSKIDKNKEQLRRQTKYAQFINLKIKLGPSKKVNEIKTPLRQTNQLSQNVLQQLKAYEDMEYQQQLIRRQKQKKIQQEKLKCKFVSKSMRTSPTKYPLNPQASDLNKSLLQQTPLNSQIKQTQNEQQTKLIQKTASTHKDSKLHSNKKNADQRIMRNQSTLKRISSHGKFTRNKNSQQYDSSPLKLAPKKDLIEETKKIRHIYNSMKTLKRYQQLVQFRKIQNLIASPDSPTPKVI